MDVAQLKAAQDTLAATMRWAEPELWDSPTPCPDWDVRGVVDHLVTGNERFVVRLRGDTPGEPPDRSALTEDELVGAYERSGAEVVEAFERPGVMQRMVEFPIGTIPGSAALGLRLTETLVHGWDLARALGTMIDFDPVTIDEAYAFSEPALARIPEDRNPFGTPQHCPDDASELDRLAALLGRQPLESSS